VFTLTNCLVLAGILFAVGAWGVIARRNLLIMLISLELMLNAVILAAAAFARMHAVTVQQTRQLHAGETGQILALFIIAVAAAEAVVGLAIVISLFRNRESVDARDVTELRQ
jgi:NADH-quinone oxidoreductase subunit K